MVTIFKNISFLEQKKLLKLLEMSILNYTEKVVIPSSVNKSLIGIILEGSLEISKIDYNGNRIIIEELFENNVIDNSFFHNDAIKILSKEETCILFLDFDNVINFDNLSLKYYNQFIKNLLEITTSIVKERNERIEILSKKTIRDKLLEYFLIESKKRGSNKIYLPHTYTDLADYLSVDRSAMSRELSNLKKEGFIVTKGRIITITHY